MNCPKCKKEIPVKFNEKEGLHFFYCADCKLGGKGKTEKEAGKKFLEAFNAPVNAAAPANALVTIAPPKNKGELSAWAVSNMAVLESRSAQFIDKPATKRMIEKNVRYAMTAELKDAWSTPEGQESIVDALQESFEIGATLPEMGSLVPFGKTVEFIPSVNAYVFALTSGKNPPFQNINIECIYENDQFEIGNKNGNFNYEIKKVGFPRGDIKGVIVQAVETSTGRVIGDAYDEPRLMEKAKKHSKNYKYYLADMRALAEARTQGKDYIEKWGKKLYENDIQNPYVGADKPEMLKKLAGKSFFAPYMKVRNARAMDAEWGDDSAPVEEMSHKRTVNAVLDTALSQVKDAEIVSETAGAKLFEE
jgi:hypothetical protein